MSINDYLGTFIKLGVDSTVEHEDGQGGVKETKGKIINPDEDGFVVIKQGNGKHKYIPKDKVVDITED